jgi:hypothetical protein
MEELMVSLINLFIQKFVLQYINMLSSLVFFAYIIQFDRFLGNLVQKFLHIAFFSNFQNVNFHLRIITNIS